MVRLPVVEIRPVPTLFGTVRYRCRSVSILASHYKQGPRVDPYLYGFNLGQLSGGIPTRINIFQLNSPNGHRWFLDSHLRRGTDDRAMRSSIPILKSMDPIGHRGLVVALCDGPLKEGALCGLLSNTGAESSYCYGASFE